MPSASDQPPPTRVVADPAHPPTPPAFEEKIGERDLREWRTFIGRVFVRTVDALEARFARVWAGWSLPLTMALIFLLGGGLVSLAADGVGEVYEQVVGRTGLAAFDQPTLDWALSHRTPTSNEWVTTYTNVGGNVGGPILALVVLVTLTAIWRRWTPVAVMLPALMGALAITVIGKEITGRSRPPHELAVPPFELSTSFPSGHTLNATVLAGLTAYLLLIMARRLWVGIVASVLAAGYAISMGLSRVWLGHHWLTDVVAGWLLGLAWVLAVITIHRAVLTLRAHREADPPPLASAGVATSTGHRAAGLEAGHRHPER